MTELTLMDVARLLNEKQGKKITGDDVNAVYEYRELADRVATEVLRSKNSDDSEDFEYTLYLSSMIQALAFQRLLEMGVDEDTVLGLANNQGILTLLAYTIKITVGISVLEELR